MGAQNDGDSIGDQPHELRRKLHERVVELRFNGGFRVVAWTPLPNVSDDTDDLRFHVKSGDMDVLTDGVLVGEVVACENVVNVDDGRGVLVVLLGDEATALQGDAHGLLESGFHQIEHRLMHVVVSWPAWVALRSRRANSESWIMGREPSVTETASTPGMARMSASKRRRRARVSAGVVLELEGKDSEKVMACSGL